VIRQRIELVQWVSTREEVRYWQHRPLDGIHRAPS